MTKKTLLAVLQQSEYDLPRWREWIKLHQGSLLDIQPAAWSLKLKLIQQLSSFFFFLPVVPAISFALWLTQPGEWLIRYRSYRQAQERLRAYRHQGLKVIAIGGSYGKTSTKHILRHTFSSQFKVLITPKSINTMLGIAQVITRDLQPEHQIFIVELGEYRPGDIKKLCDFLQPDYGILTPIGRQHLEILGSFENVITELSALPAYFSFDPEQVIIHEQNRAHLKQPMLTYGTSQCSSLKVQNSRVSRAGTEFTVSWKDKPAFADQTLFSPLFGEHQAVNTLPAFWLAQKLGQGEASVRKRIATLPFIHRRHEPTFWPQNVLILDNSYNTNADSVVESLKLLNQLEATRRFIITLGFTETGDASQQIHQELGRTLVNQSDYVGLIKGPATSDIVVGFTSNGGDESHIVIGPSQAAVFKLLQPHIIPGSVLVYEGGYQEIYV